eukprot:gene10022-6999_t
MVREPLKLYGGLPRFSLCLLSLAGYRTEPLKPLPPPPSLLSYLLWCALHSSLCAISPVLKSSRALPSPYPNSTHITSTTTFKMPAVFSPDTVSTNAQGVVCVNNVPYPMASACLATEQQIQESIRRVARTIASDYKGAQQISHDGQMAPISLENPVVCLSILKGSYIFTADMVRALNDEGFPHVCDFLRLSSYGAKTQTSGSVQLLSVPKFSNLRGKHLLILEDVLDSGITMVWLLRYLREKYQPASIRVCVLACKPKEARKVAVPEPEYSCLHVPNQWVIGYGFEVNDRYRNFRHVFVLKDGEGKRFPCKL